MTSKNSHKKMYEDSDKERLHQESRTKRLNPPTEIYRSEFRRDYARLIHSASFRRLQGKTQLFPGQESDYFRNRLTHSLEVQQIAESIAHLINHKFLINKKSLQIDTDIVRFAALAHDIGHPPFGHQGEEALDELMHDDGGFEGNAQTLRILSRLEKKLFSDEKRDQFVDNHDSRSGLNLTSRVLASVLKYDFIIPINNKSRADYGVKTNQIPTKTENKISFYKPVKGYYHLEKDDVEKLKKHVIGVNNNEIFKTIECQIMDIADDIAYSVYDLDDSLKAGFYNPFDALADLDILEKVSKKVSRNLNKIIDTNAIRDCLIADIFCDIFVSTDPGTDLPEDSDQLSIMNITYAVDTYRRAKKYATNAYYRTTLTSFLVGKFIRGVEFELNEEQPALSKVYLKEEIRQQVEILKTFNYESQILSSRLKTAEYRGKEIIKKIFEVLEATRGNLLPSDHKKLYDKANGELKKRIICDFIASMTDRYCIEFYGRLTSENPETIFKPSN